mgnify:CR=1 FL=1
MPFKFNPFTNRLDITDTAGGGSGSLDTLTGDTGGAISPDGSNNINIVGSGAISVSGNSLTNTLTISTASPFFTWSVIVGNQTAITQEGYFTNGGARVELSLPALSAIGDTFAVSDVGGNGWKITQGAGQQIQFGSSSTTLGGAGYLESTMIGDGLLLVCDTANTFWTVVPGSIGNITVN